MRRPEDVTRILRKQFGRDYPSWARGQGRRWPWRIPLDPPTTTERARDAVGCHEWAAAWAAHTGPGEVEYATMRFPTGFHRMPKRLLLSRPGDVAAAHPDDHRTWRRCGRRLTGLHARFPHARFGRVVRQITELDEQDFERLETATVWLRDNPTSGMLLRQLPIEGIHTKWLIRHATLVLALLGDEQPTPGHDTDETRDPPDPGDGHMEDGHAEDDDTEDGDAGGDVDTDDEERAISRRRLLHARLGLRVPPDLVQVSVCDPRLRAQVGGMRHFAASVEDLDGWLAHPDTVVILENKETGYAVTEDLPGTVILHGHGRYVEQYARISWVLGARRVVYWGDLDVPGLQFLSDLRAHGVPVVSILTDRATLQRYEHLAVSTPMPRATVTPPRLTEPESQLYRFLLEHARTHERGLLLEQERIPWTVASSQLRSAVECDTAQGP